MKPNFPRPSSWFSFHVAVAQWSLFTLLTVLSMRSVWPLMNGFISRILPLGSHSFLVLWVVLWIVLGVSLIPLVRRPCCYSLGWKLFILAQLGVFVGAFLALYPDVHSLYFELLPTKLLSTGILPVMVFVALMGLVLCARVYRSPWHWSKVVAYAVNGILLVGVCCMGFMALAVRSPAYYRNTLDARIARDHPLRFAPPSVPRFPADSPQVLHPNLSLPLDSEFGGYYWMAGDLTGDGQVEVINLKYYVEAPDRNRVASLAVQDLNAKRLWHWQCSTPPPKGLGFGRGSSAAVVVFNLKTGTPDGQLLMATDGLLYQFDGKTGEVVKSVDVGSMDASDCLTVANLRGTGRHEVLLKDAYHTIWAFDEDLNLLWKRENPGGYLLAHRIAACDLDGDGKEEILTGAAILDGLGSVRSVFRSNSVLLWYGGHVDGIVPLKRQGAWCIGITYCDGCGMGLYTPSGDCLWEVTGDHFEYLIGGYFFPDDPVHRDQFQLMSKVHYREGNPQVMVNEDGTLLGVYSPCNTAFAVDWTGDGYHELVYYSPASIYSGTQKLFDLDVPGKPDGTPTCLRVADFAGPGATGEDIARKPDGIPDIGVMTEVDGKLFLHIYLNRNGQRPANDVYPGVGWEEAANYFTKYYDYRR